MKKNSRSETENLKANARGFQYL